MGTSFSSSRLNIIWLPALVGVLLCALVFLLVWTLREDQLQAQREEVSEFAELFASDLQRDLETRIPALQRMAERWGYQGGTPKEEFVRDAQSYINDFGGYQAIEWVDSSFHVRWVVPLLGNEQAVGLNLGFERNRLLALEKAKSSMTPTMSNPIDLVQGGKGVLVYSPIFSTGNFDGFLLAVFRSQNWINTVLRFNEEHDHLKDVRFVVAMDGVTVFEQAGWNDIAPTAFDAKVSQNIMGHLFTVYCRPTAVLGENANQSLPYIAAAIGFVLSLLVTFTIFFFQKANAEAWIATVAKETLEKEILEREATEKQLKQTSSRLALATKAGNVGVWEWDVVTNDLRWNALMFDIYNIPDDVIPKYETWRNSVAAEDVEAAELLLQKAVAGEASFDTEFRINVGDGTHKHLRAAAKVERNADGDPLRVIGVNWDITQRKHAAEELATERRRLADIIRGTNVGTWEWNIQTGETFFNERWANIIGYSLSEISPTSIDTWMGFAHPDDLERSGALLEKHFNGELEYYECEARMKHRNGEWIWVLDRGKVAIRNEDGEPLLMSGTHKDITEQKLAEEKIQHLATHDTLTDLPSLRLAKDRIGMAIAVAERKDMLAAVLFVDLDGFKQVNDTLGHDAGDLLLKETAKRLQACVRHVDTVARIGGDEFLIVLSEMTSREDVGKVAEKIVSAIGKPYEFEDKTMGVGASVGIALCDSSWDESGIDLLVKMADDAMYSIKKSGKNGYAFAEADA